VKRIQNIPEAKYKRIIIVGGGFAGLNLARSLFKSGFQIVLLDQNNYHQFQPLLYQVATAGLEPSAVSFPFRRFLQKQQKAHFRIAKLEKILPESNEIITHIGAIDYDFLVLATGLKTNYFGIKNIEKKALPMKSVSEALLMRNTILQSYEKALNVENLQSREAHLNMVIVGGGPTGVELAGALAEMKNSILPKDYPELNFDLMSIFLFEAGPDLLASMSEQSSLKAKQFLEKLGVIVRTDAMVKDYNGTDVLLNDGTKHLTYNLIWTAGVTASTFEGIPETSIDKGNRMIVNEFNQVKGFDNIFAIGDTAVMKTKIYSSGHPQVAQVAIQQAKNLGNNLKRMESGKNMENFIYRDKGSLATIGRYLAVADLGKFKFQGFFAWLLWSLVHVLSLIGVKNKLMVLMDWTWNYLTYDPALRLMIKPSDKKKKSI